MKHAVKHEMKYTVSGEEPEDDRPLWKCLRRWQLGIPGDVIIP